MLSYNSYKFAYAHIQFSILCWRPQTSAYLLNFSPCFRSFLHWSLMNNLSTQIKWRGAGNKQSRLDRRLADWRRMCQCRQFISHFIHLFVWNEDRRKRRFRWIFLRKLKQMIKPNLAPTTTNKPKLMYGHFALRVCHLWTPTPFSLLVLLRKSA